MCKNPSRAQSAIASEARKPAANSSKAAKEFRMDNLFELVDGTVALVDYESDYEDSNKVKYLNYLTGVVNRRLREKVDAGALLSDREQQIFILAGILVFTDKVIDQETAKRIRSVINMTKVDMIYYEEKQQALKEQAKAFEKKTKALEEKAKVLEKMAERREKQAKETNQKHIALKMIKDRQLSFDKISEYSGLDIEDINRLAASVL